MKKEKSAHTREAAGKFTCVTNREDFLCHRINRGDFPPEKVSGEFGGQKVEDTKLGVVRVGAWHSEEDVRSVSRRVVGFASSKRIRFQCVQCNKSVDLISMSNKRLWYEPCKC